MVENRVRQALGDADLREMGPMYHLDDKEAEADGWMAELPFIRDTINGHLKTIRLLREVERRPGRSDK
jgi:hypothetical protein